MGWLERRCRARLQRGERAIDVCDADGREPGSSVVSKVRSGLSNATRAITGLADRFTAGVKRDVSGLGRMASFLGSAVASMDPSAIRRAFGQLKGGIGAVWTGLRNAKDAMTQRMRALWNGLSSTFTSAISGVQARAEAIGARVGQAAAAVGRRIASMWNGLQQRAGQLSGVVAGAAMRFVQGIIDRLISAGRRLWDSIRSRWDVLQRKASEMVSRVGVQLRGVREHVQRVASSALASVRQSWSRLTRKYSEVL